MSKFQYISGAVGAMFLGSALTFAALGHYGPAFLGMYICLSAIIASGFAAAAGEG